MRLRLSGPVHDVYFSKEAVMVTLRPDAQASANQPIFPTNSVEFVNSIAHYYRGEMSRMISWRDRLDRTTNWAIGAAAAMLSVSLSTPQGHHGVLLFAMLLVFLLLYIESRRYRFFDVYRSRVRLIERNYYAHIFGASVGVEPSLWMNHLSEDLQTPRFSISLTEALARRLRRNYIWLFLILLMAWALKTTTVLHKEGQPQFVHSTKDLIENASVGYMPGWLVLLSVLSFYGWMVYVMLKHKEAPGELAFGEVHV
jgi:uncharacterized membrane protein